MPGILTAAQICTLARQVARATGFFEQSGLVLNQILSDLCQDYDLDAARKTFNFTFTPATAPIGNQFVQLASGPFTLPVDYLRARRGDIYYWPNGPAVNNNPSVGNYPLKLVPIDIDEFDGLVQQSGFANFPVFWVTDMSTAVPVIQTTGSTHADTNLNDLASTSGLAAGQGVSGPGLTPGTLIDAVVGGSRTVTTGDTHTNTTLDNLGSTTNVVEGQSVSGTGIPSGTLVASVDSSTSVTLSQATTATATAVSITFGGGVVTLNQAATSSVTSGPFMFGVCPNAYVWPPASGAYPCMVRYQSQMPPIPSAETSSTIPWFPNQGYLRQKLEAAMFELANDDRFMSYNAMADESLRKFLTNKDDHSNRSIRVTLDQRRFGSAWDRLPKSKKFGY